MFVKSIDGQIPEELYRGKKLSYGHLRVFGFLAYSLIDKEDRKKLDSKSQKCAFIGYGGDEYGYRLWDYENNKVFRSRNVIFHEEKMYKDRKPAEDKSETDEYVELDINPSPATSSEQQTGIRTCAGQQADHGLLLGSKQIMGCCWAASKSRARSKYIVRG